MDTTGSKQQIAYAPIDAAREIGISRSGLYEELRAGRIGHFKHGSRTLIPRSELEGWVRTKMAGTGGEAA